MTDTTFDLTQVPESMQSIIKASQGRVGELLRALGVLRFQFAEKERQMLAAISAEIQKLDQFVEIAKAHPGK